MLVHDRFGSGPPLVLVHGIGSRRGVWKPVIDRLAQEREVWAIDVPGFGDSPVLPDGEQPSIEALARAIAAWCGEMGLERPHVAGNSMGGWIALELARMDAVASATGLSPAGFWNAAEARWARFMLSTVRTLSQRVGSQMKVLMRSPAGRQALLGMFNGRPVRKDPDEAALDVDALANAPAWDAALRITRGQGFHDGGELHVPVTIGWGTRDRLLIPRQAERARAALPQGRHVPLPGCGHIPMSDDPEGVAALLLAGSS